MSSEGSEVVRLEQRVPFTMVDNPIIRALDDYVALGLYVDMLSWPPGWRINLRELSRTHKQGRQVLTAAMNDLIERGLVFRVRYQQAGGLWMTRTYVCARAVTKAELLEVRAQYLGRCRIETSAALSAEVNPGPDATGGSPTVERDTPDAALSVKPSGAVADASEPIAAHPNLGVLPSARFPALGEPASGLPAARHRNAGQPTIGRRARQRSDPRPKIPPPHPPDRMAAQSGEEEVRTSDAGQVRVGSGIDDRLADALIAAWPTLTDGAVRRLAPELAAASAEIGHDRLVEHLTSNTGGAVNAAAVLRARLRDLPRVRVRATLPPWCRQCSSPDYRWIENDGDGLPLRPCPHCSAQAVARRAATGQTP